MRNIFTIIFISFITACKTTGVMNTNKQQDVSKIVFKVSTERNENLEAFSEKMRDSLIQWYKEEYETDSIPENLLNIPTFSDVMVSTPNNETVIEISKDTIWKYNKQNGKMIGDFQRLAFHENKIYYHAKIDKKWMYRSVDLNNEVSKINVEKFPNDRKIIFGYDCYKVIFTEEINDEFGMNFMGMPEINTYELFVTEDIKIPISAIFLSLKGNKFDFFPLFGNVISNVGIINKYEVTEIRKSP